jgi:hypothetical protein
VGEEERQPLYLCPVCLKKWMVEVTEGGHGGGADESEFVVGRYVWLTYFAEGWKSCKCGLGTMHGSTGGGLDGEGKVTMP